MFHTGMKQRSWAAPSGCNPQEPRSEEVECDLLDWTGPPRPPPAGALEALLGLPTRPAAGPSPVFGCVDETGRVRKTWVCGRRADRPTCPVSAPPALPPVPAPALPPALSALLEDAERQWHHDRERPVDAAEIAALFNELRRYGPGGEPGRRPVEVRDLTAGITAAHIDRFHAAMGVCAQERARMRTLSFRSGLLNPLGGLLANLLNFGVAPILSSATGNPWVGTGFSLAVAFVLQAVLNAGQQTTVVALCETWRERGPTIVIDKQNIHDGKWINDLPHALREAMAAYGERYGAFARLMQTLADRHGVAFTPGSLTPSTDAELGTLLAHLTPQEHIVFDAEAGRFCEAEACLQQCQVDLLRAQGSVQRQKVGNRVQSVPRSTRSAFSNLLDMLRGVPAGSVPGPGQHVEILSSWQTTGLKNGLVLAQQGLQMLAAGADEARKQDYNVLLNLLFAGVLHDAGERRCRRGLPVRGGDVDPSRVRKLVASPATALVQRMNTVVEHLLAATTLQVGALEAKALARAAAASSAFDAARRAEEGRVDFQFTQAEGREYAELRRLVQDLLRDQSLLRQGRLLVLAGQPDSFVGALLAGRTAHYFSRFLVEDLRARYARPGEFSSQFVQRLSSMFIGFAFGTAVSSTVGKAATIVQGGSSQVSRGLIGGLAGLSFLFASVGALTQYLLISIKNHRRLNTGEVSAGQQLWRGVLAPWHVYQAGWGGRGAMREANALLDRNALSAQLGRVLAPEAHAANDLPEEASWL